MTLSIGASRMHSIGVVQVAPVRGLVSAIRNGYQSKGLWWVLSLDKKNSIGLNELSNSTVS